MENQKVYSTTENIVCIEREGELHVCDLDSEGTMYKLTGNLGLLVKTLSTPHTKEELSITLNKASKAYSKSHKEEQVLQAALDYLIKQRILKVLE